MDPIAPGASADQDHDLAGASGVVLRQVVALDDAQAGDVDQAVACVLLVEEEPSRDRGYSHAVPVVPDPRYDAADEIPGMLDPRREIALPVDGPEAERVRQPYGLCAHADDVPQDAPYPGGRATVGLDRGWMVVALDPQGVAVIVIEDHDARVPPGQDVLPVQPEDELLEDGLGALVAAVLAPGLAERLELHVGGVPALGLEVFSDPLHLVEGQPEAHVLRDGYQDVVRGRQDVHVVQLERNVAFDHRSGHRIISR